MAFFHGSGAGGSASDLVIDGAIPRRRNISGISPGFGAWRLGADVAVVRPA